jgi:trimeric autotransporter adhesin
MDGASKEISDNIGGIVSINNSRFEGNSTVADGGAVYLFLYPKDSGNIKNTTAINNRAGQKGGGFFLANENFVLNNVSLIKNSAKNGGGLATDNWGNLELNNSLVVGNIANEQAGGILIKKDQGDYKVNLTNLTVSDNVASDYAGAIGLWNTNSDKVSTKNSVYFNNKANNSYNSAQNVFGVIKDEGNNFQFPDTYQNTSFEGYTNVTNNIAIVNPLISSFEDNFLAIQNTSCIGENAILSSGAGYKCLNNDQILNSIGNTQNICTTPLSSSSSVSSTSSSSSSLMSSTSSLPSSSTSSSNTSTTTSSTTSTESSLNSTSTTISSSSSNSNSLSSQATSSSMSSSTSSTSSQTSSQDSTNSSSQTSTSSQTATTLIITRNNNGGGQSTLSDPMSCNKPLTGTFFATPQNIDQIIINFKGINSNPNNANFSLNLKDSFNQNNPLNIVAATGVSGLYNYTLDFTKIPQSILPAGDYQITVTTQIYQGLANGGIGFVNVDTVTYTDTLSRTDCIYNKPPVVNLGNDKQLCQFTANPALLLNALVVPFGDATIVSVKFEVLRDPQTPAQFGSQWTFVDENPTDGWSATIPSTFLIESFKTIVVTATDSKGEISRNESTPLTNLATDDNININWVDCSSSSSQSSSSVSSSSQNSNSSQSSSQSSNSSNSSNSTSSSSTSMMCTPGQSTYDGCNTCQCDQNGQFYCTLQICFSTPTSSSSSNSNNLSSQATSSSSSNTSTTTSSTTSTNGTTSTSNSTSSSISSLSSISTPASASQNTSSTPTSTSSTESSLNSTSTTSSTPTANSNSSLVSSISPTSTNSSTNTSTNGTTKPLGIRITRNNNNGNESTIKDPISCELNLTGDAASTQDISKIKLELTALENNTKYTFQSGQNSPINLDLNNNTTPKTATYSLNLKNLNIQQGKYQITANLIDPNNNLLATTTYIDNISTKDCQPNNNPLINLNLQNLVRTGGNNKLPLLTLLLLVIILAVTYKLNNKKLNFQLQSSNQTSTDSLTNNSTNFADSSNSNSSSNTNLDNNKNNSKSLNNSSNSSNINSKDSINNKSNSTPSFEDDFWRG